MAPIFTFDRNAQSVNKIVGGRHGYHGYAVATREIRNWIELWGAINIQHFKNNKRSEEQQQQPRKKKVK